MTAAQRLNRDTRLLTLAQGAAFAVSGIALTIAPLTLLEMPGGSAGAGATVAVLNLAGGAGAFIAGRLMARRAPWRWLAAGHAVYGIAGVAAALAVMAGSCWAVLLAVAALGAGQGAALLGRVAVTAMHAPRERGRLGGRLLAAGAVGALAGPPAVAGLRRVAETAGADPLVLPWLLLPALALTGLAAVLAAAPASTPRAARARAPRDVVDAGGDDRPRTGLPSARSAVLAVAASQATMVGAMAVAPVAVRAHTGSDAAMSLVVMVHLLGVYALAPLVGRLVDARGHRAGLSAGAALTALGGGAIALAHAPMLAAVGVLTVGVGWSATYLSATAVLGGGVGARGRAVGSADLVASGSGASAALAGGLVVEAGGLAAVGPALALPALIASVLAGASRPVGRSRRVSAAVAGDHPQGRSARRAASTGRRSRSPKRGSAMSPGAPSAGR